MRYKYARRRGFTSLLEAIICVILLSTMLISLLGLSAASSFEEIRAKKALTAAEDATFLMDRLREDVKSSDSLSCEGDELVLYSDDGEVRFTKIGQCLYRNDELLFENIDTFAVAYGDADYLSLTICFVGGDPLCLLLHR